jgi:Fe-S cluster biogenesis protein NfuA
MATKNKSSVKKTAKKVIAKKKSIKKPVKAKKRSSKQKKLVGSMTEQVEKVLDTVRPYLIADGGNIELLGVDEKNGVVTVHLVGACASCPSSQVTLYSGVEQTLKEQVPGVVALVSV